MKKLVLFLCALFCGAAVFAKSVNVEIGGKVFQLNLTETDAAEIFVSAVAGKSIDMSRFGGFEFYSYTTLSASSADERTSLYKAGHVYYNVRYNAVSVAYADHDLGELDAVEIGEFADKSVCSFLKEFSGRNAVLVLQGEKN